VGVGDWLLRAGWIFAVMNYLFVVRVRRLWERPTGVHTKNVYNSGFPPSDVNSDARIGFYAKFYVGNNIAGGRSLQN